VDGLRDDCERRGKQDLKDEVRVSTSHDVNMYWSALARLGRLTSYTEIAYVCTVCFFYLITCAKEKKKKKEDAKK